MHRNPPVDLLALGNFRFDLGFNLDIEAIVKRPC